MSVLWGKREKTCFPHSTGKENQKKTFTIFVFEIFGSYRPIFDVSLVRCGCDIDMVDGVLKHLRVALSKHGMFGLHSLAFEDVRNRFDRTFFDTGSS